MTGATFSSATPRSVDEGQFVVRSGRSASIEALPESGSTTAGLSRRASRIVMPLLIGFAAFGAPAAPGVRRVFSSAAISRSAIGPEEWLMDAFWVTREAADLDEVRALNALLDLPAKTGFSLDLPE
jgi:hypothetical protein